MGRFEASPPPKIPNFSGRPWVALQLLPQGGCRVERIHWGRSGPNVAPNLLTPKRVNTFGATSCPTDPVTGADPGAAAHHRWQTARHREKAAHHTEQAALHAQLARLSEHLAWLDATGA